MAEIIEMPKLSDTMEEGGIANWLVAEGDFVEEGAPLVEIETDKATMEYASPEEGYLIKILVPAGQSSELNAPICVLGEKGEKFDSSQLSSSPAPKTAAPAPEAAAPAPEAAAPAVAPATSDGRIKASPIAKRMAKEQGIDLAQIQGSGPAGRIVMRDLEGASAGSPPAAASTAAAAPSTPHDNEYTDIPNSMMRKTIAKRLLAGKKEAPHFYLNVSAAMDNLLSWRVQLNAQAEQQKRQKVSVNDLLVLIISRALVRHPEVNAAWDQAHIRRFHNAHVAVAVALEDGLVTPVVRYANNMGAFAIAEQTKALVTKAKDGQLTQDEYSGGTFTISNLGMMGITSFTAIINPPQAAILAVGATQAVPWVGEDGEITVQKRMEMTMSCDHRVIDGALGARFLQTVVSFIENPLQILS